MAAAGAFSMREVLDAFRKSATEQREVLLEPYLNGWRGLSRFLQCLGRVFSRLSTHTMEKVTLLENLRQRHNFVSLQSMVRQELSAGRAALRARQDSGSRTVLWLHRALRWLQLFLEGLRSGNQRTSVLCTEAYNASLAAHHSWMIRRTMRSAFRSLPSRAALLEIMNMGPPEEAVRVLGEAIPHIRNVYWITQELFERHSLLDLP